MAAFNVSLPKLQMSIDMAWNDAIQRAQYMAKVDGLRAQLQRQTAQIGPYVTGSGKDAKKLTRTIYWPEICTNTVASCTDECLVATGEATDNSKDIAVTTCQEVGFVESFKRFRVSPLKYEDVIAKQFLLKMKALDEKLAKDYITFLEAHKGEHQATLTVGSNNSNDWEIPSVDWSADLIPQFIMDAELSRFSNPFLLDGANFYTQLISARANQANADGKGTQNLFNQFDFVQDLVNVEAIAPGKTYMVNPGAVAFLSANYWDTVPTPWAGVHRMWKMQSMNLPGVYYDVHEMETCTSDDFTVSYKIKAYADFFLNPLGCDTDITGILAFEKLAGS